MEYFESQIGSYTDPKMLFFGPYKYDIVAEG